MDDEARPEIPPLLTAAEFEAMVAPTLLPAPPLELETMEDMQMEPTDWVWEGRLARGAVHLFAGAPEAGKTSVALRLAATVSSGGLWPDGTKAEPGNVIIWTGEDNPRKTIKPRLIAMGADPKKIRFVKAMRDEKGKPRQFNPATDLPILAAVASTLPGGVAMLLIDPIAAVVGGKVDNGNNAGHREKLQPLASRLCRTTELRGNRDHALYERHSR
jgi:putative DNA primase/helicase